MIENSKIAWIFLAIGLSQSRGASSSLSQILNSADYINKAIPTEEELEFGFNKLTFLDLISIEKGNYSLSNSGQILFDRAFTNSKQIYSVWKFLEIELTKVLK